MIRAVFGGSSGGGGVTRAHRVLRRGLPLALLLGLATTGCATKRDIADVRRDLQRMEARQDTIYELLQLQNRQILDSLAVTTEELLNVRGELANQLSQLQTQLVQVGELTGQVQIRLNQFDQELATAIRQVGGAGGGDPPGGDEAGGATFSEATELYEAGLEQVSRGNAGTARRAFQAVLDDHPTSAVAPQAQFQIGETYVMEQQYDEALQAFDRVVERYQNSDAAPRALYRAGVIAQERGQLDRARQYFRQVISGYPDSDARRLAEDALQRMGG